MLERRKKEFDLIRSKYRAVEAGPNLEWVRIDHFQLPPGWNKEEVALLILIRPGYPTTPPDNFLVDNDLRLENGELPGSISQGQSHLGQSWLQFSYHVDPADWNPGTNILDGHNLLTFLVGVEKRLSEVS
jgi:hypothetical protein